MLCYILLCVDSEERKRQARAREKAWRQAHPEKPREYAKRYREKNLEKERERVRKWQADHPEVGKAWVAAHPERVKEIKKKSLSNPDNVQKNRQAAARWRQTPRGVEIMKDLHRKRLSDPSRRLHFLITSARLRASKRELPFDEDLYKIVHNPPKTCPCCQRDFDYVMHERKRSNRGPSLDRLDSMQGYTLQNVAVICVRCNYAKGDATLKELQMLAAYVEKEMTLRGIVQTGEPIAPAKREGNKSEENQ